MAPCITLVVKSIGPFALLGWTEAEVAFMACINASGCLPVCLLPKDNALLTIDAVVPFVFDINALPTDCPIPDLANCFASGIAPRNSISEETKLVRNDPTSSASYHFPRLRSFLPISLSVA